MLEIYKISMKNVGTTDDSKDRIANLGKICGEEKPKFVVPTQTVQEKYPFLNYTHYDFKTYHTNALIQMSNDELKGVSFKSD